MSLKKGEKQTILGVLNKKSQGRVLPGIMKQKQSLITDNMLTMYNSNQIYNSRQIQKNSSDNKVVLYNPESFIPELYVPKKWVPYARYFVHKLYTGRIFSRRSKDDFIPIKAEYIREILPRRNYKEIISLLTEGGIVESDNQWIIGKKSKGYRLTEQYQQDKHCRIEIYHRKIATILADLRQKQIWEIADGTRAYVIDCLSRVSVLTDSQEDMGLNYLRDGEIYFNHCDDFGYRLHHNICNLKKESRKYLSVGGQRLGSVDIVNSQPLFLFKVLINLNKQSYTPSTTHTPLRCHILTEEEELFKTLVQNGNLYETLMEMTQETDRDRIKEQFFTYVLFGRPYHKNNLTHQFQRLFPTICKAIHSIKQKDYKTIARLIQREESHFVIDHVVRSFIQSFPGVFVSTIHDSVVTTVDLIPALEAIMQEEFEKIGLSPRTKIEEW